jgi:hypothetical protein
MDGVTSLAAARAVRQAAATRQGVTVNDDGD